MPSLLKSFLDKRHLFCDERQPFCMDLSRSLQGCETYARVLSVHDGDTVSLALTTTCDENMTLKFACRLANVDTCELTSQNPQGKELALKAKERLLDMITDAGCVVWVRTHGLDKYGRLLVDLYDERDSPKTFAEKLIEEGLACEYSGRTAKTTTESLLLSNKS